MSKVRWLDATPGQVGDLVCWGIDIDKFQQTYRIPVFPDKWNVWLLKRTIADNPTTEDLSTSRLSGYVWRVFYYVWFKVIGGDFDHLKATLDPSAKVLQALHPVAALAANAVPANVVEPSRYILVQFVYRGSLQDAPWPVSSTYLTGNLAWCPKDATWMVDTVYAPLNQPVPDAPTWVDVVSDAAAAAARAASKIASSALSGASGPLLALGGVVATVLGLILANQVASKAPSLSRVQLGPKKEEEKVSP